MRILGQYEVASVQKINVTKCSVSFDWITPLDVRMRVGAVLVGKVEDIIRGWKGKYLSQAGKEVMIKSVTAAIPNYVMNCFKLPVGIIDNLNSSMTSFYWENAECDKGIHWKSWEKLCEDKFEGPWFQGS
ncbi:hypothetical protein LIER_43781 [Lithospermum erythrorhizon]|uniref:Uncharacterized protein n=1 Tax=Lithospermum erythrorhizon TaxID=34254 RepID=A0AAV3QX30_LITER